MTRGTITVAVTAYKRATITAAGLLVTGAVVGASRPHPAIIPVAAITLAVLLVTVGERVIPSSRERVFWAAVTVTAGGWLTACASTGLDEIKAALLTWGLIGFPLWWTWLRKIRRTRRDVLDLLTTWADVTADGDLTGSILHDPVIDRDSGAWAARVQLEPGQILEDAQHAARRLESRLRYPRDAITVTADPDDASVIHLQARTRRVTAKAVPWPGPSRDGTITRPKTLGAYRDGGPLEITLRGVHVLIAAMTGAGKSNVVNEIIGELAAARDAVIWGIDLKGGLELKPWAPVLQRLAVTRDQARDLLRDALTEIQDRPGVMPEGSRQYPVSPSRPALVVVVDEAREVTLDRDCRELLERITALGRALDVTVVMATQYPTVKALGSSVLIQQMTVKIALRVANATASRVIFGEGATSEGWNPHTITRDAPGTLYIQGPGAEEPRLARAFYVTDEKVRETVTAYRAWRMGELGAARPAGPMDGDHPGGTAPQQATNSDIRGEGGGEDPILDALATAGDDGLSMGQLLALVEMPRSTVDLRCRQLIAAGRVEKPERGRYRMSSDVQTDVQEEG